MFRRREPFFTVLMISILVFLFSLIAFAVEIEIMPVVEGQQYYVMNLGQIQTFQAYGFGWDAKTQQKVPEAKIEEVQWNFDSRFLELVEKKNDTITLRAIKDRTSKLTATGKVDNEDVEKTIFIVIKGK